MREQQQTEGDWHPGCGHNKEVTEREGKQKLATARAPEDKWRKDFKTGPMNLKKTDHNDKLI